MSGLQNNRTEMSSCKMNILPSTRPREQKAKRAKTKFTSCTEREAMTKRVRPIWDEYKRRRREGGRPSPQGGRQLQTRREMDEEGEREKRKRRSKERMEREAKGEGR